MDGTPLDPKLSASPHGNNPEPLPDCPAIVEQLSEFADDLDMLGACAVHLLEQVPRTENAASERALRRVGRIVERIAPFLGVRRRMDTAPFTEVAPSPQDSGEEH